MADNHSKKLTFFIVGAIVAAVVFALVAPGMASKLHVGGEIFLRLLTMMVVPLVVSSVMAGILGLGDVRKLGKPGAAAVAYYFCTTILAVVVGLVVVNVIRPGVGTLNAEQRAEIEAKAGKGDEAKKIREAISKSAGVSEDDVAEVLHDLPSTKEDERTIGRILNNLVLMLFTDNLFREATNTNLLPLIVFSIIFAGMLTTMGESVSAITTIITQTNAALMSFVLLLMNIAPLGIFCLVAARFGEANANGTLITEIQQTGWYMLTVISGLGIHALFTLPLILWFFTRRNPVKFIGQMSQAILTAFSTASSSATLPVTMECAIDNANVSRRSTEFVLPLGATINMDGTALYEAAAAIYIAQVTGAEFGMLEQVTVALTATLAAIGAAGIPEAGLVTMLIVLNAVGLPLEYVSLILSVDWLLDRFRTAVNTFGDSVGAAVVEKLMPPDDETATATT